MDKIIILIIILVVIAFGIYFMWSRVPGEVVRGPVNSGENALSGTIHNLPVPPAVEAARAQAVVDSGAPKGEILILEAQKEKSRKRT